VTPPLRLCRPLPTTWSVTLRSSLIAALALSIAVAAPADAATKKHRRPMAKGPVVAKVALAPVPAATPAPTPTAAPAVNSVIAIGGYVFYGLTYEQAVAAYQAAAAAAPAGFTPPPVTSVSVDVTVGGTVS
jgi:hypothetical protein